jgi:hypothetical protein
MSSTSFTACLLPIFTQREIDANSEIHLFAVVLLGEVVHGGHNVLGGYCLEDILDAILSQDECEELQVLFSHLAESCFGTCVVSL